MYVWMYIHLTSCCHLTIIVNTIYIFFISVYCSLFSWLLYLKIMWGKKCTSFKGDGSGGIVERERERDFDISSLKKRISIQRKKMIFI